MRRGMTLIEESMIDIYFCPVKGEPPRQDATNYSGPAGPVVSPLPEDPLGADLHGNHDEKEGINVLRMSGDVQRVFRTELLWKSCEAKLAS